jgi:thioredoxin-related protein
MQNKLLKTTNLQLDGKLAQRINVPLLLTFSQADCPFCVKLAEEVLQPMLISGDYTDRVLIRELMIDHGKDVIDFNGAAVSARAIFARYRLYVTPSVLITDNQGHELAERQIGINTVDYYGFYLDQAIDQALAKLRKNSSE